MLRLLAEAPAPTQLKVVSAGPTLRQMQTAAKDTASDLMKLVLIPTPYSVHRPLSHLAWVAGKQEIHGPTAFMGSFNRESCFCTAHVIRAT